MLLEKPQQRPLALELGVSAEAYRAARRGADAYPELAGPLFRRFGVYWIGFRQRREYRAAAEALRRR